MSLSVKSVKSVVKKSSRKQRISSYTGTDFTDKTFSIGEFRGAGCLSAAPPTGGTTNSGRSIVLLTALFALFVVGCKSIGPGMIARDRADYSSSISESWKRQTLLNIVKLRYVDPPIFVDVGQIVAGYSLETSISAGGQISSATAIQGNSALF